VQQGSTKTDKQLGDFLMGLTFRFSNPLVFIFQDFRNRQGIQKAEGFEGRRTSIRVCGGKGSKDGLKGSMDLVSESVPVTL